MSDPTATPARAYGLRKAGKRTVVASVHRDVNDALEAFRRQHGLTRSGAAHHLLRQALGLEPLENLN